MNNEIFTICYNSLSVYKNKTDAINFYNNCYMMSEGAERERYASILFDLNNNKIIATDNVSRDCRDVYIHTNNYYDRPLKVNLLDKLSINDIIDYYKKIFCQFLKFVMMKMLDLIVEYHLKIMALIVILI